MNRKELIKALKQNNIPTAYYNIEGVGETDQKTCIKKSGSKWAIYYSEKGLKFDELLFDSEEEAYKELYKRLIGNDNIK